jgi:hypothetical protein
MKLMLLVLSIVVLSLSSCFPVPVPVGCAPRPGYVRTRTVVRINAPRPHYHGGYYNRQYNSNRGNRGGSPRGWR